jgi:hypothetical protein
MRSTEMTGLGQKRYRLLRLPAAKSTAEQRAKLCQNRSLARPIQPPYAERQASPGQAVTRVSHCTFQVGSALRLLPFWFGLAIPA